MLSLLNKPYPIASVKANIWLSMGIGFFVWAFLIVFRPFGLSDSFEGRGILVLGYGLVSAGCLLLSLVLSRFLFPAFFKEESWKVWKELLIGSFSILLIAAANFLYSNTQDIFGFSWRALVYILGITVLVGIFPFSAVLALGYIRKLRKYGLQAKEINSQLEPQKTQVEPEATESLVEIKDYEGRLALSLPEDELVFAQAADNYVELHLANSQPSKPLIRLSMNSLSQQLSTHRRFYRCHRSFLVNLDKINDVSGNAQGLKLSLLGSAEIVPVARSKSQELRALLA